MLYRTRNPRILAGVCGGLARATNTDPILFRVILGVAVFFGGVGVLIYLLGWLFLPLEGEGASPAGALLNRGQSSTSTPATVLLAVGAFLSAAVALNNGFTMALLAAMVIGGIVLFSRNNVQVPGLVAGPAPGPVGPDPSAVPAGVSAPTYAEPFAPHGPYAATSAAVPSPPGPTTRPPRPRSILGRLTLSVVALALATLAIIDVTGADIPAAAYPALGLGVTAAGLLVGAWRGRARWLIALGVVFALALPVAAVADHVGDLDSDRVVSWTPTNLGDLRSEYHTSHGRVTLDLREVDFSDTTETVELNVGFGDVTVYLPSEVDVRVASTVGRGDAVVLGEHGPGFGHHDDDSEGWGRGRWGDDRSGDGEGNGDRWDDGWWVEDDGTDGPGGGRLQLTIRLGHGDLEVIR